MDSAEIWEALGCLVQTGIVTAVSGRYVRVKLPEGEEPSGWLAVVQSPPRVTVQGEHSHTVSVTPWTPAVNDRVLVLFRPMENGDGFVLGGI